MVHFHGVWDPTLLIAGREARRLKRPYFVTPHGMLDFWSLRQRRLKKVVAMRLLVRRHLDAAAGLHVLNGDEQAGLNALGLKAPMHQIANGVFLPGIDADAAAEPGRPTRERIEASKPYVLFLSRLHHKKGLDLLAPAFARVVEARPDLHLVVAGPDGGAEDAFRAQVAALGLSDRVHLVGLVGGADKAALFRHAACFCLPSRQEGFSIAITEALAHRCPVVISRECHFPEVGAAGAGRLTSLKPADVADAVLSLLADEAERAEAGEAARRLVEENYTWPAIAERVAAMYATA